MNNKIDESKINSPSHYNIDGEEETIKKMGMYMTDDELIAWCKGCIFSYVDRAKHKNGLEDLHKAMWHINYVLNQTTFIKTTTYPQDIPLYGIRNSKNRKLSPIYSDFKYYVFAFLKRCNFMGAKSYLEFLIDQYDCL